MMDSVPIGDADRPGAFPPPGSFVAGTAILTAAGEMPAEALRPGDCVATLSGQGRPMKPILWIGRHRLRLAGNPDAARLCPIRIRAGALGEATPHRDLLVAPDHGLLLDGALVPARLLVDHDGIAPALDLAEVTYLQIELERHEMLLAEGTPAETWTAEARDAAPRHATPVLRAAIA